MTTQDGLIVIRKTRIDDCEELHSLVERFAHDVRQSHLVTTDSGTLRRDGFGVPKLFHSFVAEDESRDGRLLCGYVIYSRKYSPISGISVWLSSMYVLPEYRKHNIGTQLLKQVAKSTVVIGSRRLEWVTSKWNTAALEFYESAGAINRTVTEEKQIFRLGDDALERFAANTESFPAQQS